MPKKIASNPLQTSERIISIDRYRGLVVFLMVFLQLVASFKSLGFISRLAVHSVTDGVRVFENLAFGDLGAPMFIFAIALTYELSYKKRCERIGVGGARKQLAFRWMALLSIGTAIDAAEIFINGEWDKPLGLNYIFAALLLTAVLCFALYGIAAAAGIKKLRKTVVKVLKIIVLATFVMTVFSGAVDIIIRMRHYYLGVAYNTTTNHWSTLEAIGMAGIIAMPAAGRKTLQKLAYGIALLAAYTVYHEWGYNEAVNEGITQGGLIGACGWALILIFGMVLSDLIVSNNWKMFAVMMAGLFVVGAGLVYYTMQIKVPVDPTVSVLSIAISKRSCSPSYAVLTTFSSAVFYLIIKAFDGVRLTPDKDILVWWGKNPLLIYVLQELLISTYTGGMSDSIIKDAPLWLALIQTAFFTVLFFFIAWFLNKKNRIIKL